MKKSFLLLIAAFPFAASAIPVNGDGSGNMYANTLTVHGEAVTRIAPDELTLPVTVREENPDLRAAKDRHDTKLKALLALASEMRIPKEKIQTSYTQVNPVYDYENGSSVSRPRLRGYEVTTSLEFKMTDFTKLGTFMNGIVDAGIDNVGSVTYSLQNEDKVKDDTLNLAMEHAYAKASRLAATAKVALDRPLLINEGDAEIQRPFPPRPMMFAKAMVSGMASAPPELPSGMLEIRQNVTVTYSLK